MITLEHITLEVDEAENESELILLRDQMVINEAEINHQRRYGEIIEFFNAFINPQIIKMKRENEEYLYFLDSDDPKIQVLEEKLVSTHSDKLKEAILSSEEGIPDLFIGLAIELFDDKIRDGLNQNK